MTGKSYKENDKEWAALAARVRCLKTGIENDTLDRAGNPLEGIGDFLSRLGRDLRLLVARDYPAALPKHDALFGALESLSKPGTVFDFGHAALLGALFNDLIAHVLPLGNSRRLTLAVNSAAENKTFPAYLPSRKRLYATIGLIHKMKRYHAQGKLAWFFDLDGTLTNTKPGVHTGVPADLALEDTLNTLADQAGGALAVVTGRPDIFVKTILPGSRFPAATEHGAVLSRHAGDEARLRVGQRDLSSVKIDIESQISHIGGAYVEDHKQASLTIQFTDAADPAAHIDFLKRLADSIVANPDHHDPADPLYAVAHCVPGNHVVEILPVSADKGAAVLHLMDEPEFKGKTPVFFGDSEGDRKGMVAAKEAGGFAIGIGPAAPECADIRLTDHEQLRAFLRRVAEDTAMMRRVAGCVCPKPAV